MQSTPATPIRSIPPFVEAFTPSVPPLPNDVSHHPHSASASPIADVFTNYRGTADTTKPLPPIQRPVLNVPSEESLVLVEQQPPLQTKVLLPEKSTQDKAPSSFKRGSRHIKRRSMSLGEIDVKKTMAGSSLTSPPSTAPHNGENRWDTTLNGILSDFKGELSQLDPITSSLELRDPTTPARRAIPGRSKTDGLVFPYTANQDHRTPTLTLQPAPSLEDEQARKSSSSSAARSSASPEATPNVSSRTSLTPTRSGSGSSQVSSAGKFAPNSLRSPNGYTHTHSASRDSIRLRMHHRSSASTSEPSLVPIGGDARIREHRFFCK